MSRSSGFWMTNSTLVHPSVLVRPARYISKLLYLMFSITFLVILQKVTKYMWHVRIQYGLIQSPLKSTKVFSLTSMSFGSHPISASFQLMSSPILSLYFCNLFRTTTAIRASWILLCLANHHCGCCKRDKTHNLGLQEWRLEKPVN